MKVRLRELPDSRTLPLSSAFLREALAGAPQAPQDEPPDALPGEVEVEVELSAENLTVFARGALRGWVLVACSRCAALMRLALDESFAITYLPPSDPKAHALDSELELDADDLDVTSYDGEVIDLEPIMREHVVLAVPYAPLCRDACKGLCPRCGADLNAGPCGCPDEPGDPRLSVLEDLKV